MSQTTIAVIGLGANLGDPVQSIIDARKMLEQLTYCSQLRSSSLYWTSPVGFQDQNHFVNCVVELQVSAQAAQLFADMQQIEVTLGRVRCVSNQNAPRSIDLDLLIFGEEQIDTPELTVPHPRIFERRFVIEPMLELNQAMRIDETCLEAYYAAASEQGKFDDQQVFRLGA